MKTPQRAVLSWTIPAQNGLDQGVGQLILDVSINEQHGANAEVTTHQVETGSDIADHIRPIPQHFSVEAMISNSPIGGVTSYMNGVKGSLQTVTRTVGGRTISYQAFMFDQQFDRVREVYGDLIDAIQGAALFTITTTLATYEDMAAVNFAVPRNVNMSDVLRFTMDFQKIRFVSTQTVAALPARTVKHRGAKTGKPPTEPKKEEKARSTIKAGTDFFGVTKANP